MGILSIKKRHKHRLSIQSVFPGLPNRLLIRKKPPAIEKRSKVWVPSLPYVRFSPHTARTKTPKSIPSLFFHLSNPRSNLRSPGAMKWGSFLRLSYVSAWLRPEPRRHSGGRMRVGRPTTT
ncbi:UNVERIFIED_CONTAM: hypothetical protein Sangu_0682100 [Sesamum angustifolium]|uniref:Uncharacterized protein n=1 Tax=Sesamum angustifolium TaxID=2727405 RepID=A0AAW2PRG9_9LAMI